MRGRGDLRLEVLEKLDEPKGGGGKLRSVYVV